MASSEHAPYAAQDGKEIASLVKSLESSIGKSKGKGGFSCKKGSYDVAGKTINSWRFQDWDYKRDDLPTYARGLFTYKRRNGTPEIASRGYDKFFNVSEIQDTKWENVEMNTRGPYELSVKENGCIIFVSGLEDDTLLVCSKHSTGPREDADLSHAVAGERWVEKHLASVGRTKEELAGELCDDSFEEHVLAYDERSAGLYLHGMNLNLPEFATYPGHLVHKFADEWGFKKAQFLVKDDIETVRTFLEHCAETGSWEGKDTEGFVIRCQKRAGSRDGPYADWFFKFKFEEPYLLYRQWRECTKAIISGKAPRFKKHKQVTEEYLRYARRQLSQNPKLAKAYQANHGIIAMRDGFLRERGLKGSDIIREEYGGTVKVGNDVTNNIILAPVATIGCGKTTVAVALTKLFGWGHIQNDNITGQKGRPKQFSVLISNALMRYPVVIADRNNHQKRERKQLIDDISKAIPNAQFVALHYVHDPKPEMIPKIREVTQERVFARGDNHQTIRAGSKSNTEIAGIMEGFLERFEPLDVYSEPDIGFSEVINLDVLESSRHNLELVVNGLREAYPKLIPEAPSPNDLDEAIANAMDDYQPELKHDLNFKSKNSGGRDRNQEASWRNQKQNGEAAVALKPEKTEYFAVKVPKNKVLDCLDTEFSGHSPTMAKFYRQLQQGRRLNPAFHVTLMHRASISQHNDLWQHLTSLHIKSKSEHPDTNDPPMGHCNIQFERIVWDSRVMSIVVRILDENWSCANEVPHITVGTAAPSIKPKESNDLLRRWLQEGANAQSGIWEAVIKAGEVICCDVRAVTPSSR
jgi:tRNA ligase